MNRSNSYRGVSALLGAAVLALVLPARAGTNNFVVPSFRGSAGSSVAGWERFTVATDNGVGNSPDIVGSNAAAKLVQRDPNAFVTSTGNIYNMAGKSVFEVSYSNAGPVGRVVFQTRSFGTELDYGSVKLTYGSVSIAAARTELDRLLVGEPGTPGSGAFVSSKWEWDLSGSGATTFKLGFDAASDSLSFDSATLDIATVPEPTTVVLVGVGLAGLWFLGNRRR